MPAFHYFSFRVMSLKIVEGKKFPKPEKTIYFFLVMTACVKRTRASLASDGGSRRIASIARYK
jgi:hypothetical protein